MQIKINIPDGRKGKWEVQTFTLSESQASLHNLSESRGLNRRIEPGIPYKRLMRYDGENISTLVMTNTPAEVWDLVPFIEKAFGKVLIFGLGLGMVVQELLEKPEIESITVIEIDAELIDFVGAYYTNLSPKVKVLQGDALTYHNNNSYDAIWFDIWDIISEDNLEEMQFLKKKWRKNSHIRMCWAEKECRRLQRQNL